MAMDAEADSPPLPFGPFWFKTGIECYWALIQGMMFRLQVRTATGGLVDAIAFDGPIIDYVERHASVPEAPPERAKAHHQPQLPGTDDRLAGFRQKLITMFELVANEEARDLTGERDKKNPNKILGKPTLVRAYAETGLSQGTVHTRLKEVASADGHPSETPRQTLQRLYATYQENTDWRSNPANLLDLAD
jgi:hypothetical protein